NICRRIIMAEAARAAQYELDFTQSLPPEYKAVMTPEVQAFVAELADKFTARRDALLKKRAELQNRLDAGELPDFRPETKDIRESEWKVAPIPPALLDRHVEITGPVDRKMIINALNCGAKVLMADFEASLTPIFTSVMDGQE